MPARYVALALVIVLVASVVGVGAAPQPTAADTPTPTSTPPNGSATGSAPMGQAISMFMQASAAQTVGSVENGMWVAAFANTTNQSAKRALVKRRVGQLNASVAELQAERRALQAAYRNGSIDRVTYRARLSTIVGRLAALDESIETADSRGRAVGVNTSQLQRLRSAAGRLAGPEISRIARNLSGNRGPPADIFNRSPPGPPTDRGPLDTANRSNRSTRPGPPSEVRGNRSRGGNRTGPPTGTDRGPGGDGSPNIGVQFPVAEVTG